MTLLNTILNTDREMIIITDHHTKMTILKSLSEKKVFKAMRFLTKEDLLDEVFFKKDPFLSYQMSQYLLKKPSLAESLIPYLYFIDLDANYESERLILLKTIKAYLLDHQFLKKSMHKEMLFKDKVVLVSLDYFPLKPLLLKTLEGLCTYQVLDKYPMHNQAIYYKRYHYYKDEIADVAHDINVLLKETNSLDKVKVAYTNHSYLPAIKEIFQAFNLPIFSYEKTPLIAFELTQNFLNILNTLEDKPLYEQLNEAISELKTTLHYPINPRIMTKLIQTLNPFILLNKPFSALKDYIHDTLEFTMIKTMKTPGIMVGALEDVLKEPTEYLFVLGTAETMFPHFKKEDSFLSKKEKETIGYPTAAIENTMIKAQLIDALKAINHVTLTYSKKGLTDTFYEATMMADINNSFNLILSEQTPRVASNFGRLYDLITTKIELDYYKRYGQDHTHLKHHYHLFKDAYTAFDNQFKGLKNDTLEGLIKTPLKLSYTKLNTYFKCKFRYLIEYLLQLKEISDTLTLDIGTFFHAVLEKYIHEEQLTETMLDETLEVVLHTLNRDYHAKEQFFLRNSYKTLKKVFEAIKDQHTRTSYQLYKQELKLNTIYEASKPVEFNGVIDKLLLSDDQQGVVIIDYKTGKPTLNLSHSYYGFDSQLVFYALLLQKAFKTANVHGFYEQTIFPKPFNHDPSISMDDQFKEALKLNGYTINNLQYADKIDHTLENDSFIKSMKLKKDGSFQHYAKVFDKDGLDALINHLETLITVAINDILKGDFTINPKQDQAFNDLSCTYCSFKDICYKKKEDYQTLKIPKDDETLFKWVKEKDHGSD
ncbi:MAG: PD-(D/E)XK nuclease family protein [Candidatus Izemoplasmataceae bacterium]